MPGYSLHHLDQRTVAVEFPCCDGKSSEDNHSGDQHSGDKFIVEKRIVKGRGQIVASDATGRQALHVIVHGPAEYFEFVFDVARFSGRIEHGARFACDFAIRLDNASNPFLPGTYHSAAA